MRAAIDRHFEQTLAALINSGEPQVIQGGRKGLEKESLRVTPDGRIAQTPHPAALGSALTNEHITTDYSEALIELVTPVITVLEMIRRRLGRGAPECLPTRIADSIACVPPVPGQNTLFTTVTSSTLEWLVAGLMNSWPAPLSR